MATDHITITIGVEQRWWFLPAAEVLMIVHALIRPVSCRAASHFADASGAFLARHGVRYVIAG